MEQGRNVYVKLIYYTYTLIFHLPRSFVVDFAHSNVSNVNLIGTHFSAWYLRKVCLLWVLSVNSAYQLMQIIAGWQHDKHLRNIFDSGEYVRVSSSI